MPIAANSAAAEMRIVRSGNLVASAEPTSTAGTFAIIIPSVVPAVTVRTERSFAASATVAI